MSFLRLVFIILAIYFAYRFIFHFALPVYRASRRMRDQFKGMQDMMNENMREQEFRQQQESSVNGQPRQSVNKDYIDFEEIK